MDSSSKQFGLAIAYLLPGFIGLAGIAPFVPAVAAWLYPLEQTQAGVGPPVYAVLAATTIGMIVSCFRWIIIDHIHLGTGSLPPIWDDSRLDDRLAAFDYLVESHYRYYLFVSNTLCAIVGAYTIHRWAGTLPLRGAGVDLVFLILCGILFVASRDALAKYYTRTARLLGRVREKDPRGHTMYNGNDHQFESTHPMASPAHPQPETPRPAESEPDSPKAGTLVKEKPNSEKR